MASVDTISTALDSLKFARYEDNPELFGEIPKSEHRGPSTWAHTLTEGPSVLKGYKPLKKSGKLDGTYKYTEVTPVLGREFYEDARLADILENEELLRDLAITVSERGVVFFKNQHELTVQQQLKLADALGKVTNKPKSAGLHIHPTAFQHSAVDELTGKAVPELWTLDTQYNAKRYGTGGKSTGPGFHTDIAFEPVPASYAILRLKEAPSHVPSVDEIKSTQAGSVGGSGGDTIWASGYGLAEKVSPEFLSYLEKLTGEYTAPGFERLIQNAHVPFWSGERGAPENVGEALTATHPLVRTNPVTGWKSIYGVSGFFTKINEVSAQESDYVRRYLLELLYTSPELQLRYKWNENDVAIWDNRSTFHSIIHDLRLPDGDILQRVGIRSMSLGERPFLDPHSKLRSEVLSGERLG